MKKQIDVSELEPWKSGTCFPKDRFGRLTVISIHKKTGTYLYFALCQCDCGSPPFFVYILALRKIGSKGHPPTRSCGCFHKEAVTTHGSWNHPIYRTWKGMMERCYNPKNKRYIRYGGRGITVCDRWQDVKHSLPTCIPVISRVFK